MGLLSGTLLGPVKLLAWTARQVLDVAEAELYDEDAIREELAHLNHQLDRGEIDEPTFDAAEDVLLQRLREARDRRAR